MKRKWRLNAIYLALAATALVNSGCLLVAAGAAGGAAVGYAYFQGKVCEAYNAGFEDAWTATRTSLTELSMPLLSEERETAGSGYLESRTPDGDKMRIYLDTLDSPFPAEGPLTRICVRVATFGDHPASERLLDQVAAHLVAMPSTGPPPLADGPEPPVAPPLLGSPRPIPATAGIPPQTAPPPLAN